MKSPTIVACCISVVMFFGKLSSVNSILPSDQDGLTITASKADIAGRTNGDEGMPIEDTIIDSGRDLIKRQTEERTRADRCDFNCGEIRPKNWDRKCTRKKEKCGGCNECSTLECGFSCADSPTPWDTKCAGMECEGCPQCSPAKTPSSPPNTLECGFSCADNPTPWDTKCAGMECEGCPQCSQTSFPSISVKPSPSPTSSPTVSSFPSLSVKPTSSPTVSPKRPCVFSCPTTGSKKLRRKCIRKRVDCGGCPQCEEHLKCKSKCARPKKTWEQKCKTSKCAGCDECN